mmetsp:Transcript_132993/g.230657  ORF Transcript_132993/g.230657 Transcript_132993/m.230657 type:complete len:82 (-) Transcript_132993:16-261(-)
MVARGAPPSESLSQGVVVMWVPPLPPPRAVRKGKGGGKGGALDDEPQPTSIGPQSPSVQELYFLGGEGVHPDLPNTPPEGV